MKLTHPEPSGSDKPFKWYACSQPSFTLLTASPKKDEIGSVTLHLDYAGPMGAPASQLLILSPEELARLDAARGVDKLRADLEAAVEALQSVRKCGNGGAKLSREASDKVRGVLNRLAA